VGLTKKQAVQTLEALVALAYKNAKNSFTIPGLGKIVLVNRKARMGRNPATGETIKIAAKRVSNSASPRQPKTQFWAASSCSQRINRFFTQQRRIQLLSLFSVLKLESVSHFPLMATLRKGNGKRRAF